MTAVLLLVAASGGAQGAPAAPTTEAPPPASPTPVPTAAPQLEPRPAAAGRPEADDELDRVVAELRQRAEAVEPGSAAADALDRALTETVLVVYGRARDALGAWSGATSDDAADQAWERLTAIESSLTELVKLRQSNRQNLSQEYVDSRLGIGLEGWRQLTWELDLLALKARLYKAHRLHDVALLPERMEDLFTVGGLAWHAVLAVLVVAVAGWLKRRGPDGLERVRQAAFHSFRSLGWKRRTHRLTNAIEVLLPWGCFVLAVGGLRWALGPLSREVEIDVALRLALLYGAYRLSIDAITAMFVAIARRYDVRVTDEQRTRLGRSVRTLLRLAVLLALIRFVSSRWLGRAALFTLVDRFAWLIILVAILGELFRWRTVMVDTFLELGPDSPLAASVRESRDHWYGVFLAPAAFFWLAFHGLVTVLRDFALQFDETQKALAFLFRRKVERQAEREGYADELYDDLPPAVIEAFDESAVDRGPLVVSHFPELEDLQNLVSAWCKTGAGGSALLHGERGIGKTTWLNQLRRDDVDVIRIELDRRITEVGHLVATLADKLGMAGDPRTVQEISDRLMEGPKRIVAVDLAQHLFLARIGGYEAFRAYAELINRTRQQVFWITAMAEYASRHLRAVHPDWAVFRREIALSGWSEERIRELVQTRCKASGVTFNYADVAVDRIEGVTTRARLVESADGYLRLLWDYSSGNPRIALHFFVRSLDPDRGDRLRVRLFRAPDSSNLEAGGEAGLFVLAAIMTHESASVEDLATVTRSSVSQCHIHVDRLVDLGAARVENGMVRITTTWQRTAVRLLRRRNLLPG